MKKYEDATKWGWRDWIQFLAPLFGGLGAAVSKNYLALVWVVIATVWFVLYTGETKQHWRTKLNHLKDLEAHTKFIGELRRRMYGASGGSAPK